MKTLTIYLIFALTMMLLSTLNGFSQTGSPEFNDTSQMITKEELIQQRADNKARLEKERDVKRQKRDGVKIFRRKKHIEDTSKVLQKEEREEKSLQNSRKNAGSKSQKNFYARDKADK